MRRRSKGHRLTAERRKRIPKRKFGLPGRRAYPMNDRSHAISAEGRARQELDKGKLSEGQYREVISKARRVLGEGRKSKRRRS